MQGPCWGRGEFFLGGFWHLVVVLLYVTMFRAGNLIVCSSALKLDSVHAVCAPVMKAMVGDTVTFALVQR